MKSRCLHCDKVKDEHSFGLHRCRLDRHNWHPTNFFTPIVAPDAPGWVRMSVTRTEHAHPQFVRYRHRRTGIVVKVKARMFKHFKNSSDALYEYLRTFLLTSQR